MSSSTHLLSIFERFLSSNAKQKEEEHMRFFPEIIRRMNLYDC